MLNNLEPAQDKLVQVGPDLGLKLFAKVNSRRHISR